MSLGPGFSSMTTRTGLGAVLLAVLVVVGMTVPAMALTTTPSEAATSARASSVDVGTATTAAQTDPEQAQNDLSVNVTVGQQLSTVIDVSSGEVQTDFENTAFELAVERADDERRAEAIAERAEDLRERAEAIHEAYEEATEAYEEGELTRSEYAQRLATLNARASNLLDSYEQLRQRATNVSALELRAAGVNRTALAAAVDDLRTVSGTGASALLARFTGESEGEIELETRNGLAIEVTSEGGESSREFERPRDDDDALLENQSDALTTARAALSSPGSGTWVLTESNVQQDDGVYEFAFTLRNSTNLTGEAEVAVDGSSGQVFALEEEVSARDGDEADENDEDEDENDRELALLVTRGTPGPGETITVQVLADGAPVEDVDVRLNDRTVGTTDANGTLTVTLPTADEVELTAETDDAEAELEFEFESESDDEDDDVFRNLNVDSTLDGDTVTTTVRYDGDPVPNASVYADGDPVGTTGADGVVTFTVDAEAAEDVEISVVKGAFEAELTYAIENGALVLTEEAHESDDDGPDSDDDDSEESAEDEADEDDDESEDEADEDDDETETPDDEDDDDDRDDDEDEDDEETDTPEPDE